MSPDDRVKWLASLQTFDKVWIPEDPTGPGRAVEIVVRGDGAIFEMGGAQWRDMRLEDIRPLPPFPYGQCSDCGEALARNRFVGIRCAHCAAKSRQSVCPNGCGTREECERKNAEIRKIRADEIRGGATQH